MKHFFAIFLATLFIGNTSFAVSEGTDVRHSKDSPIVTRYPGSWIIKYSSSDFDKYVVALNAKRHPEQKKYAFLTEKFKVIEGIRTSIDYRLPKGGSQRQVYKNYENALKKKGYSLLFDCYRKSCAVGAESVPRMLSTGGHIPKLANSNAHIMTTSSYLAAEKVEGNKITTVAVMVGYNEGSPSAGLVYRIDVIESTELDLSQVTVTDLNDKLATQGRVALYGITFEFNSARVQSESERTLQTIADYLAANPRQKVYVVGHTDNVGSIEANLSLSERRAEAVVAELINSYGVASHRLAPKGVAMLSPVAPNTSEAGRELNRRVEIVAQ
ncbi:OmpA family protein [Simiduia aestuariiviva]|uniref:Outer membrane protein OmpA-like peptidoglycan-associated protein n=1 Tax=Simiduia aestuariiviva TaxID=1510459 RepID=A0A839UMM1_9GAMM|nr:OmpA family protein [Simiduia aestuariiviva]MBB3167800.1 outer membrane protein OmpA-like peptidoglycan-associated protein [Simiduia aestuariiviva]